METFATYEDAWAWLNDANDEGIAEETEHGQSFIAKITHFSAMEVMDRKENYHKHDDTCPADCEEEEWPYDSDWDVVGRLYMRPVEEAPDV
jgi:hypothetical protein